ncbi:hypothetical protein Efla_000859 [Eimeria flavescens]
MKDEQADERKDASSLETIEVTLYDLEVIGGAEDHLSLAHKAELCSQTNNTEKRSVYPSTSFHFAQSPPHLEKELLRSHVCLKTTVHTLAGASPSHTLGFADMQRVPSFWSIVAAPSQELSAPTDVTKKATKAASFASTNHILPPEGRPAPRPVRAQASTEQICKKRKHRFASD